MSTKPRQARAAREQAQDTEKARITEIKRMDSFYAQCFSTKAGQEVLKDLIQHHQVMEAAFFPEAGKVCSHSAAHRDGSKSVVTRILRRIAKHKDIKILEIPLP